MPIFEHPSFVQLRQPSVQARQLASGATKIDFSAGLIDFVSGLEINHCRAAEQREERAPSHLVSLAVP
jgi:hypothetical protein